MRWLRRFLLALKKPNLVYRRLRYGASQLSIIDLSEIQPHLLLRGVIIEAGASDGVDTLALRKRFAQHMIFAIEPVKEQFEYLQQLFRDSKTVKLANLALSNKKGISEINIGTDETWKLGGMGSSSLLRPTRHESEFPQIKFTIRQKVKTTTLHDFAIENNINLVDLLWLDLQGLEYSVLKASAEWIMENVNCIHLELCRVPLYLGASNANEVEKFSISL